MNGSAASERHLPPSGSIDARHPARPAGLGLRLMITSSIEDSAEPLRPNGFSVPLHTSPAALVSAKGVLVRPLLIITPSYA